MEWKQVINKRNKNYKQYLKYYNRTYIGKFQTINNKYYLKDILNFDSNNTIVEITDFNNNIILDDDIIETELININSEENILYIYCSVKNIIRRKYNIIYGIIKNINNNIAIIHTYFLNNNTKMIYVNNKNLDLKLYDKVICKILNYDNNTINIDVLEIIGNLYNKNEILDTLIIENNYINLKELLDKETKENNRINNKNNIFVNYFTNFENIKLDNTYIKNYTNINSNIPNINSSINSSINNKNNGDLYCYINNNDCIIFKLNDNILTFSYSINHFISNKYLYNNNLQIFYRILNLDCNKKNSNDFNNANNDYLIKLNNNIKKYYNKYKNFSSLKNIQKDIQKENNNILTFNIDINLTTNIIEKSYYSYNNIKLIDNNFFNNYIKNLVNIISNKNIYIKKYYYLNNINNNIYLINEYISFVLYKNIKNLIDIIPIKKFNNYDFNNNFENVFNNKNVNNSYLNVLKNNNIINYINLYKPYNLYWTNSNDIDKNIYSYLSINNPYNNFFDSYLINIFINTFNNTEKTYLKNIDKNYLKNLENMNISEKICYKIENTYNIDLLLNILNNNDEMFNNIYNATIIKIKPQGIFINMNINYNDYNFNFVSSIHISLLSHLPLYYSNNSLKNENVSYTLKKDINVKIESFNIFNRTINLIPLI